MSFKGLSERSMFTWKIPLGYAIINDVSVRQSSIFGESSSVFNILDTENSRLWRLTSKCRNSKIRESEISRTLGVELRFQRPE